MRSVPYRLYSIFIALIVALTVFIPAVGAGAPSSTDYVPMPPGDFILYRSDHFDIYYDPALIIDVSGVVVSSEAAYDTVTGFFGAFGYRARVILAADHQQYTRILYSYSDYSLPGSNVSSSWGDGERSTIVIEAPGQIQGFDAKMAHELSHAVMRTKLADNKYSMPGWFSEGLAIYVSGDRSGNSIGAAEDACRNNKAMTVAQMEAALQRPEGQAGEEETARAQSGMLMGFIAMKYGNDSIKLIMQDFASSGDLDGAFSERIGYTPEDINAGWKAALKGQLSVRDGQALSRVYGYAMDLSGKPIANVTIIFTCMRNDSAVFNKSYITTTNNSGYYYLDLPYGQFSVHAGGQGYPGVDDNITLQKNETRAYNVTLSREGSLPAQDALASPQAGGDRATYIVLGVLNAVALLAIALVFWRTKK